MFENIMKFFKKFSRDNKTSANSKDAAKERLHLVLMQDRANVSADFLELMKQEIIEVIKKYIDVDESAIDVRLTNKENADGTNGAPALYANIPIINIKDEKAKADIKEANKKEEKEIKNPIKEEKKDENKKELENAEIIIDNGKKEEEKNKENKIENKNSDIKDEIKSDNKKENQKEEKIKS